MAAQHEDKRIRQQRKVNVVIMYESSYWGSGKLRKWSTVTGDWLRENSLSLGADDVENGRAARNGWLWRQPIA
jgi:hypothetical protein